MEPPAATEPPPSAESYNPPPTAAIEPPYNEGPPESKGGDDTDKTAIKMIGFNLGGMLSIPMGDSSDVLNVGGGFVAGISFRPTPVIGLRAEYSASWYGLKSNLLSSTNLDGNSSLQYLDLDIVVRPARVKRVGFYLLGGPGIYWRSADITKFDGVGVSTYCEPGAFFCYPTAVPVDRVLASHSTTDFGINGGIGMFLVLTPPLRLYLEARFHYIWGPEFTDVTGKKRSANGEYLPITLGVGF